MRFLCNNKFTQIIFSWRTKEFRAKTQEDMGGLLPGDDVKSLWPQYRKHAALIEVTHRHPELHKDVIIKRYAVRE